MPYQLSQPGAPSFLDHLHNYKFLYPLFSSSSLSCFVFFAACSTKEQLVVLFFNLNKQKEQQCKRVQGQLDFKFFLVSNLSYLSFCFILQDQKKAFVVILVSLINDTFPLFQIFENVYIICRDEVEAHCLGAKTVQERQYIILCDMNDLSISDFRLLLTLF